MPPPLMSPAGLKGFLPEFEPVDDNLVQQYLDLATLSVNQPLWGQRYNYGVIYLAAHNLALALPANNADGTPGTSGTIAGAVTGQTVGRVSRQNAAIFGGASQNRINQATNLASTKYGIQFLTLQGQLLKTPTVC